MMEANAVNPKCLSVRERRKKKLKYLNIEKYVSVKLNELEICICL